MNRIPRYAILGAGNGGLALAAELSMRGRDFVLFDFADFDHQLQPLREAGGVEIESRIDGFTGGNGLRFTPLKHITNDIACVADADVVIVVAPAQHHRKFIDGCLPHLRPGQLVFLNPGGVGGALLWHTALKAAGKEGISLCQPSDLLYAGYRKADARVVITGKKAKASLGAFPHLAMQDILALLADDFPEYFPAANIIEAGMSGPGMLVHPLPMLMNAVNIDKRAPYSYDSYDITPTVAKAIEMLDRERCTILTAMGVEATPAKDILTQYYGVAGPSFYETVIEVPAYRNSTSPTSFRHRFIAEEVPTQIVPTLEIGNRLGLRSPVLEAVVTLASAAADEDFRKTGWTSSSLGIGGLDKGALLAFFQSGEKFNNHTVI